MTEITQEYLKQIVRYDPETGLFHWVKQRNWRTPAGKVAGTSDKDGYIKIRIDHRAYMAHRLAIFYMTGEWPNDEVDHENLIKSDNRWENLREATTQQNAANRAVRPTKKEMKGAYRDGNGFKAVIGLNGKTRYIGWYRTEAEANAAYLRAAQAAHGEFARP